MVQALRQSKRRRMRQVLDQSRAPLFYNWYAGGEMNIVHNLIDRHVNKGKQEERV